LLLLLLLSLVFHLLLHSLSRLFLFSYQISIWLMMFGKRRRGIDRI
jgi:hypothetical protein